jgi:ribosomal protein S6--L-glutamate ligase
VAILAQPESWYWRDLQRAATLVGVTVDRQDFSQLQGSVLSHCEGASAIGEPDVIVVRTMPPGSLEQVVLRMDLLARLQATGVRVVNSPKSLECAVDKYLTTARLGAAGLPVPDTIVCETAERGLEAFARLGGDVVIKPLFGAEGRGIVRVTDAEIALRVCRTLERVGAVLYLQRFLEHGGSDLRVLTLGGRVLGGMRRYATSGFRTNVSQQGRAEACSPTAIEAELALRAADVVGADFAGVDLLTDSEGRRYILEVNAVPGWRAFARVHARDIAAEFLTWLTS